MTTSVKSAYTHEQISAWQRGLLTIAWADGHFDPEERELIVCITRDELTPVQDIEAQEQISPEELATQLGHDEETAEDFLRTAVMVAVADGVYSPPEAEIIRDFSSALGLDIEALKSLESTLYHPQPGESVKPNEIKKDHSGHPGTILQPVKDWLDGMKVKDPRVAKMICRVVPAQCPFERDINLFGRKIAHIPAMCELNPLYEQLVGLRFRCLSYLADDCDEDVTPYI